MGADLKGVEGAQNLKQAAWVQSWFSSTHPWESPFGTLDLNTQQPVLTGACCRHAGNLSTQEAEQRLCQPDTSVRCCYGFYAPAKQHLADSKSLTPPSMGSPKAWACVELPQGHSLSK